MSVDKSLLREFMQTIVNQPNEAKVTMFLDSLKTLVPYFAASNPNNEIITPTLCLLSTTIAADSEITPEEGALLAAVADLLEVPKTVLVDAFGAFSSEDAKEYLKSFYPGLPEDASNAFTLAVACIAAIDDKVTPAELDHISEFF